MSKTFSTQQIALFTLADSIRAYKRLQTRKSMCQLIEMTSYLIKRHNAPASLEREIIAEFSK